MAGKGVPPKNPEDRRNRATTHEWKPTTEVGWQHGDIPKPPSGLLKPSRDAWQAWFAAWFAAHWKPEDLPALRQLVRLYDQVERGEFQRHGELRLAMDTYGITPKGQMALRYQPPKADSAADKPAPTQEGGSYGHLKAV